MDKKLWRLLWAVLICFVFALAPSSAAAASEVSVSAVWLADYPETRGNADLTVVWSHEREGRGEHTVLASEWTVTGNVWTFTLDVPSGARVSVRENSIPSGYTSSLGGGQKSVTQGYLAVMYTAVPGSVAASGVPLVKPDETDPIPEPEPQAPSQPQTPSQPQPQTPSQTQTGTGGSGNNSSNNSGGTAVKPSQSTKPAQTTKPASGQAAKPPSGTGSTAVTPGTVTPDVAEPAPGEPNTPEGEEPNAPAEVTDPEDPNAPEEPDAEPEPDPEPEPEPEPEPAAPEREPQPTPARPEPEPAAPASETRRTSAGPFLVMVGAGTAATFALSVTGRRREDEF